jgi:hypothetical protein
LSEVQLESPASISAAYKVQERQPDNPHLPKLWVRMARSSRRHPGSAASAYPQEAPFPLEKDRDEQILIPCTCRGFLLNFSNPD